MKLNHFLIVDLKAVRAGEIFISSAGFEFDGNVVDGADRERLDLLWTEDLVDAKVPATEGESATLFLTASGEQALARAEQESQR